MAVHFTIITPTIIRGSLADCIDSVKCQTYPSYEHLIIEDVPPHGDCGNWARWQAFDRIKGEYVYYLDDDNILAHPRVLEQLASVDYPWALVPILREGERFYHDPPEYSKVDTGNMLIRRDLAQWPLTDKYEADWLLCERLLSQPCQKLPDLQPVMIMERANRGQ